MGNKSKRPPILYQYRPPESWALGNLCRRVLYFGPPAGFNDPYEWLFPPRVPNNLPRDKFEVLLENIREQYDERFYQGICKRESQKERANLINGLLGVVHAKWRTDCGVACFSKREDNPLMWAHYAGRNKGFCLGFGAELRLGAGERFREVEYSDKLPDTNVYNFWMSNDGEEQFMKLLLHKPVYWEYEQEWRLIRKYKLDRVKKRAGVIKREKSYKPEALKSVYLGVDAELGTTKAVRAIIEDRYPDTELWQMRPNKNKYELKPRPLNEAARVADARRART